LLFMSVSSRFALEVLVCAVLTVTFWSACAGVGLRLLPQERAAHTVFSRRRPGIAACVGLGVLLMIGGVALVLRIPWWFAVVPFVVSGLVFAVRDAAGFARRSSRSALVLSTLAVGAVGIVAVVESLVGLRFPLNRCDDLRAYLPMARRLLATSAIDEPWSVRRAESLGGFDLLRALPVAVFGNAGFGVAETAIAGTFLAGLFIGNGLRAVGTRVLSILLILGIPFVWVPRVNTTGVLFAAPLLVAVLAATAEMRSALRARDGWAAARWAAAGGLVIAALMAVRPNLGLLGAMILASGVLLTSRSRVASRAVVVVIGGMVTLAAVGSWSLAMWRTVGTPLYPLFSGNVNTAALQGPPVGDLGHRAHLALDLVRSGPYLWVVVAVAVVSVLARRNLADAVLLVIACGTTVVVTALFALNTPLLAAPTFARYAGPMSEGLAVFLVYELVRAADVTATTLRTGAPARPKQVLAVAAGVTIAAASFSTLGLTWSLLPSGHRLVALAAQDGLIGPTNPQDTASLRQSYRDAMASLGGERTIAAVDRPYLLDYGRFDVPNMDAPGFMTPSAGSFPFFSGPGPKIAELRRAGFDVLLATDPDAEVCLNPARISGPAQGTGPSSGIYRRFLDWEEDVQAIERLSPDSVRRFGDLLRIDLRRAGAQLGAWPG
jgi:hypothetical protein